MFTHLHVHSYYSLLKGTIPLDDLIKVSCSMGFTSIALTDIDNLYGVVKFTKLAKEHGIKPIIGVELTSTSDDGLSVVVIANDRDSYSSICQMITERHLSKDFDLTSTLIKHAVNCTLLVPSSIMLHDLRPHLKTNLYANVVACDIAKQSTNKLIKEAKRLNIPLVLTNNVFMLSKDNIDIHRLLRAIDLNKTLSQLTSDDLCCDENNYLMSETEISEFCNDEQWMENAVRIADNVSWELPLGNYIYPVYNLRKERSTKRELIVMLWKGFHRRYSRYELYRKAFAVNRLLYELHVILDLKMEDYFMIVYDIVKYAREKGIPHIGRGSAASSIVSYCLELTPVDPIRYNLYFERFLNHSRQSPPDIDIDFAWKHRNQILKYVYERYGTSHVAMICELITFKFRSSVRETAKAFGLPEQEIKTLSRRRSYEVNKSDSSLEKKILSLAECITHYPSHISIHAGGIFITDKPLTYYTPLERSANGIVVSQFEMYSAEDIGFIKIDLLSQRSLSVVMDTLKHLSYNGIPKPDLNDFEMITSDKDTCKMIACGKTMGCFYIESPAMRQLLKKLDCDTYEMVVIASSIIRPGVAESGMMQEFITRHFYKDKSQIKFLHPRLKDLLAETYGVMVYQEDVIRIAHEFCGLTLTEADSLRRAMSGKLRSRGAMVKLKDYFIKSTVERNIPSQTANELWRQIESFSRYSFCKAHSASYAVLSFQVAYLKAHHPAEFMASVLSNQGGFYSTAAYISEAKRLGLTILQPDINHSDYEYSGFGRYIRVGFQQIKNISKKSIDKILQNREEGIFQTFEDFMCRVNIPFTELKTLIALGLFDSIDGNRPFVLWKLYLQYSRIKQFDNVIFYKMNYTSYPAVNDYNKLYKALLEVEYLSYPINVHWFDIFNPPCKSNGVIRSIDIKHHKGKYVSLLGIPITSKTIRTKSNLLMRFITLEDRYGVFEIVLFPKAFSEYGKVLQKTGIYLVEGFVQEEYTTFTINAKSLKCLTQDDL